VAGTTYDATSLTVYPAENGYTVTLGMYESSLNFVAHSLDEVITILRQVNLRTGTHAQP